MSAAVAMVVRNNWLREQLCEDDCWRPRKVERKVGRAKDMHDIQFRYFAKQHAPMLQLSDQCTDQRQPCDYREARWRKRVDRKQPRADLGVAVPPLNQPLRQN